VIRDWICDRDLVIADQVGIFSAGGIMREDQSRIKNPHRIRNR
jgi:hypothetical protein